WRNAPRRALVVVSRSAGTRWPRPEAPMQRDKTTVVRKTKAIVVLAAALPAVAWTAACSTMGRHVATTSAAVDAGPAEPSTTAAAFAPAPCGGPGAPCPTAEIAIVVDPKASTKPISNGIYGVAFA